MRAAAILPLLIFATSVTAAHDDARGAAVLARVFKAEEAALVGVSADGQWILTRSARKVKCADATSGCRVDRLAVYDPVTGALAGELLSAKPTYSRSGFGVAAFTRRRTVEVVEYEGWDAGSRDMAQSLVEWDPASGSQQRTALPPGSEFWPLCAGGGSRVLGTGAPLQGRRFDRRLQSAPAPRRLLPFSITTAAATNLSESNCVARTSGAALLVQRQRYDDTLHWISADSGEPARVCRTFPGERIHGFALSPDGTLLAVASGVAGRQPAGKVIPADYRMFLSVLDGANCAMRNRFELAFPVDTRESLYTDDFARRAAISPDGSLAVLAYGVRKGSDGIAYFGVYSLSTGRRLMTFQGDAYQGGFWASRRTVDVASASMAPFQGALQFSADSRRLYATSRRLRVWDISGLR